IHYATREKRYRSTLLSFRAVRRVQRYAAFDFNIRHQRLSSRHAWCDSVEQSCRSNEALDTRRSIELQHPRKGVKPPGIRKDAVQHEARYPMGGTFFDDLPAHFFHHVAKMDTRRTRRFAGTAVEATKHVLDKCVGNLGSAFVKSAHQVNSPAR